MTTKQRASKAPTGLIYLSAIRLIVIAVVVGVFMPLRASADTLTITTSAIPPGAVDTPYTAAVEATGGNGSYTWRLVSGALPPGLALLPGVCIAVVGPCQPPVEITGIPTREGVYTIYIEVTDNATKASIARAFTIHIDSPPPAARYFRYTMRTGPEESLIVQMTTLATIKQALADLDGARALVVSGVVRSGNGGFNGPWSWHLDPATIEMAETFTEICDGTPSYIEEHLPEWLGERYCPWDARINAVYNNPPPLPQPKATAAPAATKTPDRVPLPQPKATAKPAAAPAAHTNITRFTRNIAESMRGADVATLQEFLARDPTIYPEGLVTGYFGPLTRRAVINFQERHAREILAPLGLSRGTGFVGLLTRAKLHTLAGTP